jgi:ferric-dicitrate binding protein FerR (iron transport regulator)
MAGHLEVIDKRMKDIQRLKELYAQYKQKKCSAEELKLFFDLLGRLYFERLGTNSFAGSAHHQAITGVGECKEFALSDGTVVKLGPESKLHYAEIFKGQKRFVQLEGQAVFNVVQSKEYPFVIQTGLVIVQSMGGCINVVAYPEEAGINVLVLKGQANVHIERADYSRKLTANTGWKILVDKAGGILRKEWINAQYILN